MASTRRQSSTPLARIATACAALLAAGVLLQSAGVRAESFEVINYTPPRRLAGSERAGGARAFQYQAQRLTQGVRATRQRGIYRLQRWPVRKPARQPGGCVSDGVARACGAVAPGPAPPPQIQRSADYALAGGGRHAHFSNGINGHASLFLILGKERRLGIVGMASSPEALREVKAFFATVVVTGPPRPPEPPASTLIGRWWNVRNSMTV